MSSSDAAPTKGPIVLLVLAYLGFVSLGLPDGVLGVAWPSIRDDYLLAQSDLSAILIGLGAGYFVSSLFAGRLIHRFGVGRLLAGSTLAVASALAGYAASPAWWVVVLAAPVAGLGSGAIDAGLNAYAARHFSARDMNWLHASWGLGTTVGPMLMTLVLASLLSWRWGYVALAGVMVVMALLFAATRRRWDDGPAGEEAHGGGATAREALAVPLVRLQMLIFFVYVGLEFGTGQWCYAVLTEARGYPPGEAGAWVSVYWGSLFAGRVLLGVVADRVGPDRLIRFGGLGALAGALVFAILPGTAGTLGLALIGFSVAPIFPMLMLRTPDRVGTAVGFHAIGFQASAAMLGGIALPSFAGLLADSYGLDVVPLFVVAAAITLASLHEWLLRRPAVR